VLTTQIRPDGVALLRIDVPAKSQNVVPPSIAVELEGALRAVASDARAVVLASAKPGSWIAGADLDAFRNCESEEEVVTLCRQAQNALNMLEKFELPVVAAIDGMCLGGGLEVALACHARIAADSPLTRLALPEVQLGLIPAAGGTQRLPELVGLEASLDLLLSGRRVDGREALQMELVDEVVPPSILVELACKRALQRASGSGPRNRSLAEPRRLQKLALSNPVSRSIALNQAQRSMEKKTRGNQPAPSAILKAVRTGLEKGRSAGLDVEAKAMGELALSDVSHRLIDLFFAGRELRHASGVDASALPVRRVGVLGAGLMGRGISYITIEQAGLPVRLKDRDDSALTSGLRAVHRMLAARVERGKLGEREMERIAFRMTGTTEDRFAGCDVVIEAVFEELELKQQLLAAVEAETPDTTIFATNTSSLPVARIAEGARRKDRVVGMHYFSPAEKMPLLEVVRTPETSAETIATAVALGQRQGKTVIVVKDGVGFYTSRILVPYLNEAAWMLSEGVSVEAIDETAKDLGFPVGPCTLLDEVGIDVAAKVARIAESAYGTRMHPPGSLDRLIQDGRTGRKGEKGFYSYGSKRKVVDDSVYDALGVRLDRKTKMDARILQDRLLLMMVQEAIRCFDEGVVASARDADVGAVFGLGFPAHLGGPLRWVDGIGPAELLSRMRALQDRYGGRFTPSDRLEAMARSGERFHG